jgi:glycosyltransferase involved in cell wall biosynthesis
MIESMATGTPVIGLRKGSVPELIEEGKTGFVVDNLDEALGALQKIDQINRVDCRTRVENNFTRKIMAQNYIKVYEKVINEYSKNKKA